VSYRDNLGAVCIHSINTHHTHEHTNQHDQKMRDYRSHAALRECQAADEAQGTATTTTAPLTMSTREIAELTGKHHADVMRDIRNLLEELGGNERSFASVYAAGNGEQRPCFNLPRRKTNILMMGYSVALRHRIVTVFRPAEKCLGSADSTRALSVVHFTSLTASAVQEISSQQLVFVLVPSR
jgi:phage regulator Rha-like protein